MSVRVIIMDVDGTLMNSQKELSPKTKETLIRAEKAGAILILASGKPTSGLLDLAKELEMEALSVEEGKAVLEHMKSFDKVRPMIDKGEYMYVNNVYDNMIQWNGAPFDVIQYESRGGKFKLCEVDDLAEFVDFELNKILTTSDPEYLQEHYQEMMEPFKDKLSCMFTGPFYFEFTAQGIDKAKALDTVLIPMGYKKEEMIAFGDGHNDASMGKYAGIGVAMENAVQDLKDVADEVTLSNDEDGIAVCLHKHMPELN